MFNWNLKYATVTVSIKLSKILWVVIVNSYNEVVRHAVLSNVDDFVTL